MGVDTATAGIATELSAAGDIATQLKEPGIGVPVRIVFQGVGR